MKLDNTLNNHLISSRSSSNMLPWYVLLTELFFNHNEISSFSTFLLTIVCFIIFIILTSFYFEFLSSLDYSVFRTFIYLNLSLPRTFLFLDYSISKTFLYLNFSLSKTFLYLNLSLSQTSLYLNYSVSRTSLFLNYSLSRRSSTQIE